MCQFISFFHRPDNGDVAVFNLESHSDTQAKLELNEKLWREGHYLPNGTIVCRVAPADKITEQECSERLKNHYPSFVEFFNWSMGETCKNGIYSGYLDLSSLTSAAGLKLPTKCGSLDLRSLTSAAGLKLPTEISGYLDLSSLTSAEKEKLMKRRKNK
jgi:hypothetical protein